MFGFIYTLFNTLFTVAICIESLALHPILYSPKRTEFTRRRIAGASGIVPMLGGIVVNRWILRQYADHSDRLSTKTALDMLACLSTFVAFVIGVITADLLRQIQIDNGHT